LGPRDTGIPAFLADEIGLAFLRRGPFVVKTTFEPVYAIRRGMLEPMGFRASSAYFLNGRRVDGSGAGPETPQGDEPAFELACNLAHLRNFSQTDEYGFLLFLSFGGLPQELLDPFLCRLDEELATGEIAARQVICEFTDLRSDPHAACMAGIEALRRSGARLCVGGFGGSDIALATVETMGPDFVRLDSEWLRRAAAVSRTQPLLASLVRSIQAAGMRVVVDDISCASEMTLAVEIGVDFLMGPFAGAPFPAGASFDFHRRPLGGRSEDGGKVVRLMR
jgi:EAL domain-containing protein (putative c-di-GMP-specific phosphodiesterase class I)